jgi:hypothetical protein
VQVAEFFREDALRVLRRWREPLIAVGVVALGLWIAARPGPVVQGFGWVLAAVAALALVPAIRRARFHASGDAPGVVTVDERRILYMGPTHGGSIAIDELQQLSLRRMEDGRAAWVLVDGTTLLVIPVEAQGRRSPVRRVHGVAGSVRTCGSGCPRHAAIRDDTPVESRTEPDRGGALTP